VEGSGRGFLGHSITTRLLKQNGPLKVMRTTTEGQALLAKFQIVEHLHSLSEISVLLFGNFRISVKTDFSKRYEHRLTASDSKC
jgi:hypothetical protein